MCLTAVYDDLPYINGIGYKVFIKVDKNTYRGLFYDARSYEIDDSSEGLVDYEDYKMGEWYSAVQNEATYYLRKSYTSLPDRKTYLTGFHIFLLKSQVESFVKWLGRGINQDDIIVVKVKYQNARLQGRDGSGIEGCVVADKIKLLEEAGEVVYG